MLPFESGRQKWAMILRILGIGLAAALVWSAWASFVLGYGFPQSYVLGQPDIRFSDFSEVTLTTTLPNPYVDPYSIYPPASYIALRMLPGSDTVRLIGIDFFSVIALAALLYRVLPSVIPDAWARVVFSFLFLALCYPLLFCIDRGNIDILVFPAVGWAIYFYHRQEDLKGTACLFPVICLKLYPAIFLFLLLRRRKTGLAISCGLGALAVNVCSLFLYQESPAAVWKTYQDNIAGFRDLALLNNQMLPCAASIWNAYKIILIALQEIGIVSSINFGFDGAFILASYQIYVSGFAFLSLLCLAYAAFYERNLTRAAVMLLLLITLSLPSGPEYRLTYVSMALIVLVLARRRCGDVTALVLLALTVIPKKEICFHGDGTVPINDIPIQALLNPIFILMAMAMLLYHARHPFDWRQAALRLRDLFLPWRWRWA